MMIPGYYKVKCFKCGYSKVVKQEVVMSICPACQVVMKDVEFKNNNRVPARPKYLRRSLG